MDNIEKDKELLARIDRLLAGQEQETDGNPDDDTKGVIDVARRLTSMRQSPSKEFRDNLKAQLVHQLAEQEKKNLSGQSFLFWEISRRKMWQGALAALIVLAIAAIILLITLVLNRA